MSVAERAGPRLSTLVQAPPVLPVKAGVFGAPRWRDTPRAVSEEHVETIRGVYERWSEGDFSAGRDLFDPLVVFVMGRGFPEAGTYLGLERVAEYMRGFLEPWSHITIEVEEIVAAGDSVVAAVSQRGTGGGSGAATELRYFQVWTFRGAKVIRFETFRERTAAFEAAGLSA